MAGNNYEINYDDERFGQVESDKKQAMTELEQTYGGMIDQSDSFYQAQIDASKQWADKQQQIQQEQTDFTIEQIEQQKAQAQKDYTKEQSGAYVDWQKQSNQYGVEAERQAAAGMDGTGFSESMQVSMYNTYQNRVAVARESYTRAVLNYDNAIKDARLQNNAALAEIAYQALQQQLELSLQGFQYKNNLILEQTNKKLEVDQMYHNRYLDVLNQINTENAMNEQIRQFNMEYEESVRQFNEEIARLKKKDDEESKRQAQELELKKQQLEEEKRQFDAQMALKTTSSGGGSGGSNTSINKSTENNSSSVDKTSGSGATIDNKSVIALGYGPISASTLANKVATGEVTATQNGNTITFKKNATSSLAAGQALLNKYTLVK